MVCPKFGKGGGGGGGVFGVPEMISLVHPLFTKTTPHIIKQMAGSATSDVSVKEIMEAFTMKKQHQNRCSEQERRLTLI